MTDKPRCIRRKLLITASALAILAIAVILFLTFVPLGNDPHTPGVGPVSFELNQSTIEANNQLNSSYSSTHSAHGQFPVRRIAIINESDHLIMRRVTDHLAAHLRALPYTDTVDVIDSLQAIAPGSELYDQYITLSAPDLAIDGMLITGQDVSATIQLNMSPALFTSRTSIHSAQELPVLRLNYDATLNHTSTTTGYESANARYKSVAQNIADQLNESLAKAINEAVAKAGARPQLPVSFTADYEPVPQDLAQALSKNWTQLLTGHGHMTPNTTVWTRTTNDRDRALTQLIQQLTDAGFKGPTNKPDDYSHWHLRYTLDDKVLDVFESRDDYGQPTPGEPAKLIIRYHQRMDQASVTPLIDELITQQDTVAVEDLLPFLRLMSPAQKEALAKRLIAAQPKRIPTAMAAAQLLHDMGYQPQALDTLNTVALFFALEPDGVSKKEVEKLGQKITGNPDWAIPKPIATQLDAAGFVPLQFGTPIEADVTLNEPVLAYFFVKDSKDHPAMIAARVSPATIPEGVYTLQVSNAGEAGMGNSHSTSTAHHPKRPWQDQNNNGFNNIRFEVHAEETDENTFHITVTLTETDTP